MADDPTFPNPSSPPPSPPRQRESTQPTQPAPAPATTEPDEKTAADAEKAAGNAAYKARNFDAAIAHYQKAWEIYKDITYLNNLSAAYFEKGEFEQSIIEAQKAVDEGREIRADFKLIAKYPPSPSLHHTYIKTGADFRAFGRIGTNYVKLGDLDKAIQYFQRSLTEHRTPEILGKLREVSFPLHPCNMVLTTDRKTQGG